MQPGRRAGAEAHGPELGGPGRRAAAHAKLIHCAARQRANLTAAGKRVVYQFEKESAQA